MSVFCSPFAKEIHGILMLSPARKGVEGDEEVEAIAVPPGLGTKLQRGKALADIVLKPDRNCRNFLLQYRHV
jgi:hypothetical protein